MKILLIETEPSGHHISLYLNAIVDKLISKNYNVSILISAKTKNFPSISYIKKKLDIKNIRNVGMSTKAAVITGGLAKVFLAEEETPQIEGVRRDIFIQVVQYIHLSRLLVGKSTLRALAEEGE